MYENNNKAIINKLARASIKANRMRNLFAIVAIILTTVLFTSVFTIGASIEIILRTKNNEARYQIAEELNLKDN